MSTNVESFDNFDSDLQIAAHQAGLVRVVLEGKRDVELFSLFWFGSMRETYDFVESGRLIAGSGCTAVRAAVDHSVKIDGVPAVGIVDRDSLFREKRWDLLFGVDEKKFASDAQTPDVYVASLWEIEAYLLEPDLLSQWVYGSHRKAPGPKAECDSALQRTLLECELLLDVAYYFAAAHVEGVGLKDSYLRGQSLIDAKAACAAAVANLSATGLAVAAQVEELVKEVRKQLPGNEAEQLRYLLRYVDTKRLMARLFHTLQVHDDSHWALPPLQSAGNRRPPEFEAFLESVGTRYPS